MGQQLTEKQTEDYHDHMHDGLADELLERAEGALDALMASWRGRRHEHLAPEPGEALLAMLGHPPDARDDWTALGRDLRNQMMIDDGLVMGSAN